MTSSQPAGPKQTVFTTGFLAGHARPDHTRGKLLLTPKFFLTELLRRELVQNIQVAIEKYSTELEGDGSLHQRAYFLLLGQGPLGTEAPQHRYQHRPPARLQQ